MRSGTVLVVAVVLLYLGAEIYAFKRVGYRMDPDYIFNLLVEAQTAANACDDEVLRLRDSFDRTLDRVAHRFRRELLDEDSTLKSADVRRLIKQESQAARQRVRAQLAQSSCTERPIGDHIRRYRIYAGKS